MFNRIHAALGRLAAGICAGSLLLGALAARAAGAAPTTAPSTQPVVLAKPLYVEVYIRSTTNRPNEDVAGLLMQYDDKGPTINTAHTSRTLRWIELTPSSAFVCRSRVIDKTKAADWLELGRFGWSIAARDQAIGALDEAVGLDPSLRDSANTIRRSPLGSALRVAAAMPQGNSSSANAGSAGNESRGGTAAELMHPATQPALDTSSSPAVAQDHPGTLVQFQKSTPEQDAAAMELAQNQAAVVSRDMNIPFVTLNTRHFLLFTDWDPREYSFLQQSLEAAYSAVSRQFDIPDDQNVFVGRLPVYMMANYDEFVKITHELKVPINLSQNLRGYYSTYYGRRIKGVGEMVMWKPAAGGGVTLNVAEQQWAHTLEHEFTHAFIARYLTSQPIPRWLNEGLAEFISAKDFPNGGTPREWAHFLAGNGADLSTLFDDNRMPTGETYPVMMEMVELLVAKNRGMFLQYFDAIKHGTDPEQALKQYYGMSNADLLKAWHTYALTH
jgi:hypothetical protein